VTESFSPENANRKTKFSEVSKFGCNRGKHSQYSSERGILVAQAGEAVQMKHLLEAALREYKKEGRATLGTGNWSDENIVRGTANT
jgi:hypothetical protein